jgi:hypothetical protein
MNFLHLAICDFLYQAIQCNEQIYIYFIEVFFLAF